MTLINCWIPSYFWLAKRSRVIRRNFGVFVFSMFILKCPILRLFCIIRVNFLFKDLTIEAIFHSECTKNVKPDPICLIAAHSRPTTTRTLPWSTSIERLWPGELLIGGRTVTWQITRWQKQQRFKLITNYFGFLQEGGKRGFFPLTLGYCFISSKLS